MMTNEITKAAQRAMKLWRESPLHVQNREQCQLLGILANAWLNTQTERVDDNESWDGPWLESVGFGYESINGWSVQLPYSGNGDPVTLWIDTDFGATLTQVGEGHVDYVTLNSRAYFTKGDIRVLCKALGCELLGGG